MSLQNGLQTISLIKLVAIQINIKDKFHFMRIGLVQVAIKCFMGEWINAPIDTKGRRNTNHLYYP